MDTDPGGRPVRGLHRYVRLVADAVGAEADSCTIASDAVPVTAYVALNERLPSFPDMDLALLWTEEAGWATALETAEGALVVLAYLGNDVLPAPRVVAAFLEQERHVEYPGSREPPRLRPACAVDDFVERLAAYAEPFQTGA